MILKIDTLTKAEIKESIIENGSLICKLQILRYILPVSRSVMANENRRILCGLFNMAGFLIIIAQNKKFSKNDKAAITPNIVCLALVSESSLPINGIVVEMFPITEDVLLFWFIFDIPKKVAGKKLNNSFLKRERNIILGAINKYKNTEFFLQFPFKIVSSEGT